MIFNLPIFATVVSSLGMLLFRDGFIASGIRLMERAVRETVAYGITALWNRAELAAINLRSGAGARAGNFSSGLKFLTSSSSVMIGILFVAAVLDGQVNLAKVATWTTGLALFACMVPAANWHTRVRYLGLAVLAVIIAVYATEEGILIVVGSTGGALVIAGLLSAFQPPSRHESQRERHKTS